MAISTWTAEQRAQVEEMAQSGQYTRYIEIATTLGLQAPDVRNYITDRPYLLKAFQPDTYETKRQRIAELWDLEVR